MSRVNNQLEGSSGELPAKAEALAAHQWKKKEAPMKEIRERQARGELLDHWKEVGDG